MQLLTTILPYIQLALSVTLIAVVLLQHSDASLGGAFGGGDDNGGIRHTRRGSEKFLFNATIVIAILFTVAAFIALIIR